MAVQNKDGQGVHLWLLLWKATRAMEAYAQQSVRSTGLGLSDFGVLEALLHKGPLPVSAIQKKVLLTSGSMTAAVDRLERAGLAKRTSSPVDRRTRIVILTEKGRKLISRLFQEHVRDMERAVSPLNHTEQKTLIDLLRKLGHGQEPRIKGRPAATRKKGVQHGGTKESNWSL